MEKKHSITEDEKESFGSILSIFKSQKLNLKYIMNWPVTIKPWTICKAPGKLKQIQSHCFVRVYLLCANHNLKHFYPKLLNVVQLMPCEL